ncbi:MAG TPA: hypothetical protein VFQ14_05310 [Thermoleophilaceae bacterium]|nr:hypothetical protein [Thermoleophilaceae bacterium]
MFDKVEWERGAKDAHISLVVVAAILVGGLMLVGLDAPDAELQAVGIVALIGGYICLFWLFHREDQARERAERNED